MWNPPAPQTTSVTITLQNPTSISIGHTITFIHLHTGTGNFSVKAITVPSENQMFYNGVASATTAHSIPKYQTRSFIYIGNGFTNWGAAHLWIALAS